MSATVVSMDRQGERWLIAILLALCTHLLVLSAFFWLDPFAPRLLAGRVATQPETIELVFDDDRDRTSDVDRDRPTEFTELPEERVGLTPDTADFLSNIDSRAADRFEGEGESGLPRMQGVTDNPQVAMSPPPPGAAAESAPAGVPEADAMAESLEPSVESEATEAPAMEEAGADAGRQLEPVEVVDDRGRAVQERSARAGIEQMVVEERPGEPVEWETRYELEAGRSDLYQEEMRNFQGNVALFGDVSLNTIAWDFAPWIQEFRRRFYRNLFPPYAFLALGMIDGQQVVDLEIAPEGRLLRMELVEERGHDSLREATLAAFRASAPYRPLPDDFPEPTLKIRITMTYILPRR